MGKALIADKQFITQLGYKTYLTGLGLFETVEIVQNISEIWLALQKGGVTLLSIDINSVNVRIPEDFKDILNQFKELVVLVTANQIDSECVRKLLSARIKNIILKSCDECDFTDAVKYTLNGKKFLSAEILDLLLESKKQKIKNQENADVTPTEIEIIRLIAQGLTNKEIANTRNLSIHTVNSHRKNIFRKLRVTNTSELLMAAIKKGYITNIEYYI